MDSEVQSGESQESPSGGLSKKDAFLLRMMLRQNCAWVVLVHNKHIVSLQPIGRALNVSSVPDWWIQYASANELDFNL